MTNSHAFAGGDPAKTLARQLQAEAKATDGGKQPARRHRESTTRNKKRRTPAG